jgi:hypothetical protein
VRPEERRGVFNIASRKDEPHQLDGPIAKLIDEIDDLTVGDEAHTQAIGSLRTLMETRNADKAANTRSSVSTDVIASAVAHLLGIGMIIGFEKANVITSKALPFVPKIRN